MVLNMILQLESEFILDLRHFYIIKRKFIIMTSNIDVRLKINVIFHKYINPNSYNFSDELLNKYFRFIAVNDKIIKEIPERFKDLVFYENQFQNYHPEFQEDGLKENSVLLHFGMNQYMLEDLNLIGFFQYDMIISELFTVHIPIILDNHTKFPDTIYILQDVVCSDYLLSRLDPFQWEQLCKIYNTLFNTNHIWTECYFSEIPIWNSFILPKKVFKLMNFYMENIINLLFQFHSKKGEMQTLCQTMEVVNGFFLFYYCNDHKIHWYMINGIKHDKNGGD